MIIVSAALFYGLKFIRKFALQIAQENHDAVAAMDSEEEKKRLKKERAADQVCVVKFLLLGGRNLSLTHPPSPLPLSLSLSFK